VASNYSSKQIHEWTKQVNSRPGWERQQLGQEIQQCGWEIQ
jgi:hypothetical protein